MSKETPGASFGLYDNRYSTRKVPPRLVDLPGGGGYGSETS